MAVTSCGPFGPLARVRTYWIRRLPKAFSIGFERASICSATSVARLSVQEERILGEVAGGKTNQQIGADLKLAEKTVKNYVSSILSKLEVARRAEAAAYLARHTQPVG